jgi:hypothetical protein
MRALTGAFDGEEIPAGSDGYWEADVFSETGVGSGGTSDRRF